MIARLAPVAASLLASLALAGCGGTTTASQGDGLPPRTVHQPIDPTVAMTGTVRIGYLHHSTGAAIWGGGVPAGITSWNTAHGTSYVIAQEDYPRNAHGYGWKNYPYDYWNLWVNSRELVNPSQEKNLDNLVREYDVIVWKHCFPVSGIDADTGTGSVSSEAKRTENYKLQYAALKARMREFPDVRFLVWTGAALRQGNTSSGPATRARAFFAWVRDEWDEPGDNVFVWDFDTLETRGDLYARDGFTTSDSHPNAEFATSVAPLVVKRIVEVIEGRGDQGSKTGL